LKNKLIGLGGKTVPTNSDAALVLYAIVKFYSFDGQRHKKICISNLVMTKTFSLIKIA